jgi:L-lactate dehydrogenase complex protein LldE
VVEVLERLGHEVVFPDEQTCCGQMHLNTGYRRDATKLARRFVETFEKFDVVVSPSASCVGTATEMYGYLADQANDKGLEVAVGQLSGRVYEFSQFLVDVLRVENVGARFPHRVTYHPTCHSLRMLSLDDAPQRLLRAVDGLELLPLQDSDSCCGFGGTFSLKNSDTSGAMLGDKLARVRETGAEVLCAIDNSCLMHIGGGAKHGASSLKVLHLAEILAQTGADHTP